MSLKDKEKWDSKYIRKPELLLHRTPSINLVKFIKHCNGKKALDLACGAGKNTIYLAENNFHVDAIDIASVAIDSLNKNLKTKNLSQLVTTKVMDLDDFSQKDMKYNLVLMCNFLDRKLIEKAKKTLQIGGIFLVETYMVDTENEKIYSKKTNLLQKDELKQIFKDYEIIIYYEYDNETFEIYDMKKQLIIAKKIK